MDFREDSSRFKSLPATVSRNMSSSSSQFFSANQSPFFSPRPSVSDLAESKRSDLQCDSIRSNPDPDMSPAPAPCAASSDFDFSKFDSSEKNQKPRKHKRKPRGEPVPLANTRSGSCDVFIGLHGRKPSLLRFADWLRAELEIQGISCFVSDRARGRNARKHGVVERALHASSFGIIILTRKSFKNPYTIEELRFFAGKKILVPVFFDLRQSDCLARDIVERRGEVWEKHGGEVWESYGGLEKEWREAVNALTRTEEWKQLEARDGEWRDCILNAVTLLATKLGRRSVVDRVTEWRGRVVEEEFPFPRNDSFVGRKKELSQLEFILFGDETRDLEKDYFELKARPRRKNLALGWKNSVSIDEMRKKGKEPVTWKESEKEIEMKGAELPERQNEPRPKGKGKNTRRKRSMKIAYGKGIVCVTGESGIGKTELLLEFAYRHRHRYKMVLWIGGESRYIRQNYLNLWSFLEVDVGIEARAEKTMISSFEEREQAAISRFRRELMRNIPFLVVIDNLEREKDWWDQELVMDLLPRFGGETHILISTRLPRVMNLEPLKLSYLSGVEAMALMLGCVKDYSIGEIDSLRTLEEKVGRLTLGLAIIGAILSELPINPSRLLDTVNRMPLRNFSWSGREAHCLRRNAFLLQLLEVCFSIFDNADGPRSLATRMVQAGAWFAPAAIPVSLLALAACKIPVKQQGEAFWRKVFRSLNCCRSSSGDMKSEAEASVSMLTRFNVARSCTKQGYVQFSNLVKLYARKRAVSGVPNAAVLAIIARGSVTDHPEHVWAACFLLFGFGSDAVPIDLKVSELLQFIKELVLPLAIRTFIRFSRCTAALELLRLCTNALEAADQAFVTPVEKWMDKSCWRPIQTKAQLNPFLWQELALTRALVLETRAKLTLRGGQFDIADDFIRKAIFIRNSVCGEDHPDTISARETLSKLTKLLEHVQIHASP